MLKVLYLNWHHAVEGYAFISHLMNQKMLWDATTDRVVSGVPKPNQPRSLFNKYLDFFTHNLSDPEKDLRQEPPVRCYAVMDFMRLDLILR